MTVDLTIELGDITTFEADAIVNSANKSLQKGSGLCKCIYEKAGEAALTTALQGYGKLAAGSAIITPGFKLKATHIIHTVTPKYLPFKRENAQLLAQCYVSILDLSMEHNLQSVAIPCLGIGHHVWPLKLSSCIAIDTIFWNKDKLDKMQKIALVCFTKEQYEVYSQYLHAKKR